MNNPRPGNAIMFRLLAIAFILYNLVKMIIDYGKGSPDAPSPLLLGLSAVVLGGGAVLIAVLTWREYKRAQEKEQDDPTEPNE